MRLTLSPLPSFPVADLLKFMPKFLKDKCTRKREVDEKLRDAFKRFKDIQKLKVGTGHYESKYVKVYEKDMVCGKHIFRLKIVSEKRGGRGVREKGKERGRREREGEEKGKGGDFSSD